MSEAKIAIEEWKEEIDENGKWKTNGIVRFLVEPSQKWIDENPPIEEPTSEPSPAELLTDYIVDVDYRVTLIELGI